MCPLKCMPQITQANSNESSKSEILVNYKTTMNPHDLQKTTSPFFLRSYENPQLLISTETKSKMTMSTWYNYQTPLLVGGVHECACACVVAREGWQVPSAALHLIS